MGTGVFRRSSYVTRKFCPHTISLSLHRALAEPVRCVWRTLSYVDGMLFMEKIQGKSGERGFTPWDREIWRVVFLTLYCISSGFLLCLLNELKTVMALYLKACSTRKSIVFGGSRSVLEPLFYHSLTWWPWGKPWLGWASLECKVGTVVLPLLLNSQGWEWQGRDRCEAPNYANILLPELPYSCFASLSLPTLFSLHNNELMECAFLLSELFPPNLPSSWICEKE